MKMQVTREDIDGIPTQWLQTVANYLMGFRNDTVVDFSQPHLRPSVIGIYPLFILMYAILILAGTLMNFAMVYHIVKYRFYRDPTYAFLINLAISDVVKCIFVLPMTLTVLLLQNWIFGKFLCYFLPMLQDIPLHVSMMTYLMIAGDRFRLLSDPGKPRIPAFVCALGAWFFAICIVLPYPIYTTYLDLERFMKQHFEGMGICVANLADDMQEYMRGLFIGTYVAPLTITAYLYVKASRELQSQEGPLAVAMFEARTGDVYSRHSSHASNDITLAKLALMETYENSGHFDITFTMFVWVAFMPTVTTPALYASWQMSRSAKERLRGYFRFSNRRLTRACEDGVRMAARRTPRRPGGLTNVAYTQHARTESVTGSNGGGGSSRGSASLHSPDLTPNRVILVQ
ncbi:prolactin-releasing peptide receptor isoform X2 [Cephus cinctus]|uniref:Prolactin-releasing peptide receptor isoform X2 n=1 Tax=Cephus cinctus TaxID=211228 RepID=A0AAJ7RRB9_CEPCN|nr:prolactin-releasing peptide receptor isoform X2 [Cephus cinctus]